MSERALLARGTVLVDPRKAVEKLRAHQLASPGLYVLEAIRAATLLGASRVELENDADDLVLSWEAAPPASQDLAHLLDHLFSTSDRGLRLLATAVNAALGLDPSFVDLYTTRHPGLGPRSIARLRFVAREGVLGEGVVEIVERPRVAAAQWFRIHVRERFGTAVMSEWLAREPAETLLLRTHLVSARVALVRGEKPLALPANRVLATVPLDDLAGVRASLELVPATAGGFTYLCELGVLLQKRALPGPAGTAGRESGPALPLRLVVDAEALDTNISRAEVDLARGLGSALDRRWPAALGRLVDLALGTAAALPPRDPSRLEIEDALLGLVLGAEGEAWVSAVTRAQEPAPEPRVGHFDPGLVARLLGAPLVPTPLDGRISLRAVASSGTPLAVWRDEDPVDPALAPWLPDTLWLPPASAALRALVSRVPTRSGREAVAEARAALARHRKLMAHPRRPVRLDDAGNALVRAKLEGEGLRGELAVFPEGYRAGDPQIEATVFVEERPFARIPLGKAAVGIRVAVQSPGIVPSPAFESVLRGEAFEAVVRALRAAFAGAVGAAATEGILASMPRDMAARMTRAAMLELAAAHPAAAGVAALDRLGREHPALFEVPAWETTDRRQVSTRVLREQARGALRAVLCGPVGGGARADGRMVLALGGPDRSALESLFGESVRWIDLSDFLPARTTAEPWRALDEASDHAHPRLWHTRREGPLGVSVAPAGHRGSITFVHAGGVVETRTRGESPGPTKVVLEDDAIVPFGVHRGMVEGTLSPTAMALVERAELELFALLGEALGGARGARATLGWRDLPEILEPARQTLLAVAAGLSPGHPHESLRAQLDAVPLVQAWSGRGGLHHRGLAEIRAEAKARGHEAVEYLVEVPHELEGEDFAALILPTYEDQSRVSKALGIALRPGEAAVRAAKGSRKKRRIRAELQQLPGARLEDIRVFEGRPRVGELTRDEGTVVYALATGSEPGRASVVVDGVVAIADALGALEFPLHARVVLADDDGFKQDFRALKKPGQATVKALVAAAAEALVETLVAQAEAGGDPGPAGLRMVVAWVLSRPRKAPAHPRLTPARLREARIWAGPEGVRRSIAEACGVFDEPVVITGWRGVWLPAREGDGGDPPYLAPGSREELEALRRLAGSLSDRTEAAQLEQRRRRFAREDPAAMRLPGAPAAPWASARFESRLGPHVVGELRLIAGAPGLDVQAMEGALPMGRHRFDAPIALEALLASPEIEAARFAQSLQRLEIVRVALELARAAMRAAIEAEATIPPGLTPSLRWHLLTATAPGPLERRFPLLRDIAGRPRSLDELDVQPSRFGALAFTTLDPGEALSLREAERMVVVIRAEERAWLTARWTCVDRTAEVAAELAARQWSRRHEVEHIRLPGEPEDLRHRVRLTLAHDGFEGELALLGGEAAEGTTAHWFRQRRALGSSPVETSWPALVALEVPSLEPRADFAGPLDNAAHREALAAVASLVDRGLARCLGPATGEFLARMSVQGTKTPAMRGGRAMAVGELWLLPGAQPGRVAFEVAGQRASLDPQAAPHGTRVPVAGHLWVRSAVGGAQAATALVQSLVEWAWPKLLERWIADTRIDPDNDETLGHLVAAMLGGHSRGVIGELARRTKLPGGGLSVARVVERVRQRQRVGVVEADESVGRDRVRRSGARWFAMLAEAGAFREHRAPTAATAPKKAPVEVRAQPEAVTPRVDPAEAFAERLAKRLRALGLTAGTVRAVRVVSASSRASLGYDTRTREAWIEREASLVGWALGGGAHAEDVLAMALLGVINRSLTEVTDAHETTALRAILGDLEKRPGASRE